MCGGFVMDQKAPVGHPAHHVLPNVRIQGMTRVVWTRANGGSASTRLNMPVFPSLFTTLTLLLLLAVSPRILPLETSAFTLPSTALTLETLCLLPSGPPFPPRTPTPAVPLTGLYQVGYEIFAAATINAFRRRPLVTLDGPDP